RFASLSVGRYFAGVDEAMMRLMDLWEANGERATRRRRESALLRQRTPVDRAAGRVAGGVGSTVADPPGSASQDDGRAGPARGDAGVDNRTASAAPATHDGNGLPSRGPGR